MPANNMIVIVFKIIQNNKYLKKQHVMIIGNVSVISY